MKAFQRKLSSIILIVVYKRADPDICTLKMFYAIRGKKTFIEYIK